MISPQSSGVMSSNKSWRSKVSSKESSNTSIEPFVDILVPHMVIHGGDVPRIQIGQGQRVSFGLQGLTKGLDVRLQGGGGRDHRRWGPQGVSFRLQGSTKVLHTIGQHHLQCLGPQGLLLLLSSMIGLSLSFILSEILSTVFCLPPSSFILLDILPSVLPPLSFTLSLSLPTPSPVALFFLRNFGPVLFPVPFSGGGHFLTVVGSVPGLSCGFLCTMSGYHFLELGEVHFFFFDHCVGMQVVAV